MPFRNKSLVSALWFLPLILLILPAIMSWEHSCLVPRADHWHMIGSPWLRHLEGASFWDYLHSPGNDSRHDVPKIFHWLVIQYAGWDMRLESMICVGVVGLSVGLLLLLCRRLPTDQSTAWSVAWLSALLLLSPQQWMNWTWGVQICYVLVVFGAVASIIAFGSSLPLLLRTFLAGLASFIAAMSFINGWLAWPLGFLALGIVSWQQGWRTRPVAWAWLLWIMMLAITAWAFFYNWPQSKVNEEQGMLQGLLHAPWKRLQFMLTLIGAPFAETWATWDKATRGALLDNVAPWIGVATIGVVIATALALWRERQQVAWSKLWPWALLALWGAGNICAITLARTGHGFATPFESRYPAYTLWFHVALLAFMAVVQQGGGGFAWLRRGWMLLLLWGWAMGAIQGWRESVRVHDNDERINAAATLRLVAPEPVFLDAIMPAGGAKTLQSLNILEVNHLLNVATFHSNKVSDAKTGKANEWEGLLKAGSYDAKGGLHIEGWAMNKSTRLAAPAVVIAYSQPGQPEVWFGLATRRKAEHKLAERKRARAQEARIGWEYEPLKGDETSFMTSMPLPANVARNVLPSGELTFHAYVLEPVTGEVTRLDGEVKLTK